MRPPALVGLLFAGLLLPGCARDDPDPSARTRVALGEIFHLAAFANPDSLAPRLIYRGDDPRRQWVDVCNASNRSERAYVDRLGARITAWLGTGRAEFLEWRTYRGEEGTWLRWRVRGANGTRWFACLDIDGVIALADMAGP